MPITDTFIMPADVVLLPVADLPESIREKVTYKDGDIAITRPHVRTPSKIVDAQAAELLKEFQTAKTIVQAILNYSDGKETDPHQALEEALPLLKNFIESRLLVSPDSPDAESISATLSMGEKFDEFEIRQPVQILEDTELYQARTADGSDVALKIVRDVNRPDLQEAFEREAKVLEHLDGNVNPRLVKTGVNDGRVFLAIEWFHGVPLPLLADEILQAANNATEPDEIREARGRLLELVLSLLESYAHLHKQGVIHSDVHSNNLLVNDAGKIKILDFGLARFIDSNHPLSPAQRGGVGYYFEPECAQAVLLGHPVPQSSVAGEQYAVAAVTYQLLTGANHLNFSLRNDEMLRQISEDETLPFSAHGLTAWPEMEEVLVRPLSKKPEERFASMQQFVERVRNLVIPGPSNETSSESNAPATGIWTSKERSALRPKQLHEAFIQRVLDRFQPDGELFQSEIGEGHKLPTCSADYGTAGIAYGLLRLASNRDDPHLLSLADLWISKTLDHAGKENAFYNEKLELTKENVSDVSLHHMVNGVYFVRSWVSHALGDSLTEQAANEAFVMASQAETDKLDITLGRSSVLHGCSLLVENSRHSRHLDLTMLHEFGDQVMKGIWNEISKFGPLKESTEMSFLGMAHGWAGVLYAALRWCQVRAENSDVDVLSLLPANVPERLTELAAWGMPAGRGVVWSWQNEVGGDFASGNNGFMPGWCNGNAGHVFLWTQAHKVLGEAKYLDLARKAAWGVWEQPSHFNNLCCGATGCAYAMLNLYRSTGDKDWLLRARQYAHRVVMGEELPTEHETDVNSLYKGEIGEMVLLDDLVDPESARMPLFE